MSTINSAKSVGDLTPPTTVFSYAQAAKGRPSSAASPAPSGKGSSGTNTPLKESAVAERSASTSSADRKRSGEAVDTSSVTKESAPEETSNAAQSKSKVTPDINLQQSSTSTDTSTKAEPHSTPTPLSPKTDAVSAPTPIQEGEITTVQKDAPDFIAEKRAEESSNTDKSSDQEQAEKVKEKSEEKEKPRDLVAAPVPTVNVWTQRREQQEALKAKAAAQAPTSSQQALKAQSPNETTNGSVASKALGEAPSENRSIESKRKPKTGGTANVDFEKSTSPQSSGNVGKGAKKPIEPTSRGREEGFRKPNAKSKTPGEKDKDMTQITAPPAAADAMAWPTPDTAQDEEKRRAQGKPEKTDKPAASRPHGKEKWVTVPFTPTAVFNTPLPATRGRGGSRGGRGGRDGGGRGGSHTANGSIGGEKGVFGPNTQGGNASVVESPERGRGESGGLRAASLPPTKSSKRSTSAGPPVANQQRKYVTPVPNERRREGEAMSLRDGEAPAASFPSANRRSSATTQGEGYSKSRQDYRQPTRSEARGSTATHHSTSERNDRNQMMGSEGYGHSRSAGPERRNDNHNRGSEYSRDSSSYGQPRERGDARAERGRGGSYRSGRNGNTYNNNQQPAPLTYQPYVPAPPPNTAPFPPTKAATYSHAQQQPQGSPYGSGQPQPRHYRNGSRSQSIPGSAVYGQFPRGGLNAPQQIAPIQTAIGPAYDYPMQTMSAMPFANASDSYNLVTMVALQLDYYFSVDNLCKDLYLRKHMDSQGFVFLSVITNFNRIRQLSQDPELIRFSLMHTKNIEFRAGPDGLDRLRTLQGWQQFVLSMEERDPSAQNDGPSQLFQPRVYPQGPEPGYMVERQVTSPSEYSVVEPYQGPYQMGPGYYQSASAHPIMNGAPNGDNQMSQTPLSAAVPDFSPGILPINGNGLSTLEPPRQEKVDFTDAEVDKLLIIYSLSQSDKKTPAPFRPVSRTFSNGSVDAKNISEELQKHDEAQQANLTNGDSHSNSSENDKHQRTFSPPDLSSPTKSHMNNSPTVLWIKGGEEQPATTLPSGMATQPYNHFRENALRQRSESGNRPGQAPDMVVLFDFWTHFLIKNFNPAMYDEFRRIAFEDASRGCSTVGLQQLINFYDAALTNKTNTMLDEVAIDYVQLVKNEDPHKERPAFAKLRSAWRNGALNMKNRKKIDTFVDGELRAELER